MLSEIKVHEDKKLIEVNLSGYMTLDELLSSGQKLKEYTLSLDNKKCLINVSEAMARARTWTNALLNPENWWMLARCCDEMAVVVHEEDGAYLRFLEISELNIETKIKLFSNVTGAYKWLGM